MAEYFTLIIGDNSPEIYSTVTVTRGVIGYEISYYYEGKRKSMIILRSLVNYIILELLNFPESFSMSVHHSNNKETISFNVTTENLDHYLDNLIVDKTK